MDAFPLLSSKKIKNKINFIKEYLNKIITLRKLKKNKCNETEIKSIYEDNKNDISFKQKIFKKRNVGVDSIRIISMIGIVYFHILIQGKGIYKYNKYKTELNNSLTYCFWHNNAFALISGIIGYKSTKYSNLLYLWLCVVFYSVSIHYYYIKYKKDARVYRNFYQDYFPVIYDRYWYFSSYFGMFIFLPAVNRGIQYLNKIEFKLLVMSILGIFVFWYNYISYKNDIFKMNGGRSPIWLLSLYIIGAYIGKFNIEFAGIKKFIICLIYSLLFLSLCFIYNKYSNYIISNFNGNYKIKYINYIKNLMSNKYNGIVRTTQAILIILFFLNLKYNKYLNKFITFLGSLTFGVYLIHINRNVIINYLGTLLNKESYNLTFPEAIQMLILKSIKLFIECIIIEYMRYLIFNILKIRNICILIEKTVFKIVN